MASDLDLGMAALLGEFVAVWIAMCALFIPIVSAARPLQHVAAGTSNSSASDLYGPDWAACKATWYGEADGCGSNGGACGYGELASTYGNSIAAVSSVLYHDGLGCGSCFQVKCSSSSHAECSEEPVTVVVTDICPGGDLCGVGLPHFDLSGTAFGNLAVPGKAASLQNLGVIDILYKRVPCSYPGKNLVIAVDAGSNPYWLEFTVKYEEGPGDLSSVEVKDGSSDWQPMRQKWGANWGYDKAGDLHGALSVRLTTGLGNLVLVAENVLPANWAAGNIYVASYLS